jgi:hypothetical protein
MRAKYILTYATDKDGLRIYGPFETEEALSAWGSFWQEHNGDDPRWNQIELGSHNAARVVVPVIDPELGRAAIGSGAR